MVVMHNVLSFCIEKNMGPPPNLSLSGACDLGPPALIGLDVRMQLYDRC